MSQSAYSNLITERIHEGFNFNRNHRIFLIYGKLTADEFLTRSLYRTTLRETLWATLKTNNIERVIFFNATDKFFFLDEESERLARRLGRDPKAVDSEPPRSRLNLQRGPLGSRNVLTRPTRFAAPSAPPTEQSSTPVGSAPSSPRPESSSQSAPVEEATHTSDHSNALPHKIHMTRSRGSSSTMSDAAVLDNLNDFIQDDEIRTAVVIEDLENLSRRFDERIKDQLAARLREWNTLKAENRNVIVLITNRDPGDEQSVEVMRRIGFDFPEIANLINVALGERQADAEGFIWYVPPPYDPEIARLLDELRLKHSVEVDWNENQRVVSWLAAEHMRFKDLDGLFKEYLEDAKQHKKTPEKLSVEFLRRRRWFSTDSDPRPAMDQLNQMIGMNEIKTEISRHISYLKAAKKKREQSPELRTGNLNLHLVLTGNPGTGKSTVARLIGQIYRDIGVLRRGHTVECDSSGLVESHVGGTALKTNARVNEALDGVLFIDEAYALTEGDDHFGQQAVTTLVARMENERDRLAVIVAGYPAEMHRFITSNPGLAGRFPTQIQLPDYLPEDLLQIFEQMIGQNGHSIRAEMREVMRGFFTRMYKLREDANYFPVDEKGKSGYRNAGEVRNLVEAMLKEQAHRLAGDTSPELGPEDIPEKYHKFLDELRVREGAEAELEKRMADLNALVGLGPVKEFVEKLVIEQQLAIRLKRKASSKTRHMIFTGNPGTGKTTVARLIGEIYQTLGILKTGHFVEARHTDLVGQYVGETAQKTKLIVDRALDGVLFIDEAYSLSQSNHGSYGLEAITTLVPLLESFRDRLVVIFAGYTREMETFAAANSGIESRLGYRIEFPDYSSDELLEIFLRMTGQDQYLVPQEVREELSRQFDWIAAQNSEQFGNARGVRVKFYDRMVEAFDKRIFAAMRAGEDINSYPKEFVLSDVPQVMQQKTTP